MGKTEEQKEKDTDRRTMSYMELMRGHLSYIGRATTHVGAHRVRQAFVLLPFSSLLSTGGGSLAWSNYVKVWSLVSLVSCVVGVRWSA